MAEGVSSCMPLVLRMVGDAIGFDSQNRRKEAYCQYLSCCIYISRILKDDAWDKDLHTVFNKDVAKLFKLMQQCQERAMNIISECQTPSDSQPVSPRLPNTQLPQTLRCQSHERSLSDSFSPSTSSHYQGQPLRLPSPPSSPQMGRSLGQDTNNVYKQQNEKRVLGLKTPRADTVNKNLSTMRKMSENLLIAKAREEAIRKKVWERQQRLQVEANRRFASAVAASKEEQEQRLLYTKILEYEQDVVWPQQLRKELQRSPEDATLINSIINKIFSSKDHPLRQLLLQYQYHVYKKLLPLLKDVNFPNKKQPKDTNSVADLHMTSNSDIKQVTCTCIEGTNEPFEKNNMENKNVHFKDSNDEANLKQEAGAGSDVELLKVEGRKLKGNGDTIDNDSLDTTTNSPKENISSYCNDTKEVLESTKEEDKREDSANLADNLNDIEERKCFKNSHEIALDAKADFGERTGSFNSMESYRGNQTEGDQSKSIISVVSSILENIILQIEEKECIGLGISGSSSCHIETQVDNDCGVEGDNKYVNVNSDGRAFASKGINLVKIKSFDLELEFCSLEDDMFESESSEEETKDNKEPNMKDCLDDDLYQNTPTSNTEPKSSLELPSNLKVDNHRSIVAEGINKQELEEEIKVQPNKGEVESESIETGGGDKTTVDDGNNMDTSSIMDLEATRKQLNEIFVDMRFFLEKLKGFIILAYEELSTPTGHDQCYAAVEYPFFQPLWPLLFGVLRRVNFNKEIALGSVMTKKIHDTPSDMGVVDRLCLLDTESLEASGSKYPFQMAVEELQKVSTSYCPLEKIECIVHVSRGICQCVEDYWENKGKPRHCSETSIGCDDLLPIFGYVIIKSGMAQLISETSAMEEFIPEGYLMGEEGYCLTTLQTALAYLVTLDCPQQKD